MSRGWSATDAGLSSHELGSSRGSRPALIRLAANLRALVIEGGPLTSPDVTRRPQAFHTLLGPGVPVHGRVLVVGSMDALARDLAVRGSQVVALNPVVLGAAASSPPSSRGSPAARPDGHLPFDNADFDAVLLLDVLPLLPDDQGTVDEAARVLRPGGRLVVRVPYRGPLAWLDALNLYRYVSDITGRGPKPPEAKTVGWRRHYHRRDIQDMLGAHRFRVLAVTGTGLGLREAVRLALLLLFRWLLLRDPLYERTRRLADAINRVEGGLSLGPLGYHLTVAAERLADDVTGGESDRRALTP